MNRSNLNTANINAAVIDPVQRGFAAVMASAFIVVKRHALARGPLVSNPTASTTLIGRALRRAVEFMNPRADVDVLGKGLVFGGSSVTAEADVSANATARSPGLILGQSSVIARANTAFVARRLGKLFVSATPRGRIDITGALSYTRALAAAAVVGRASITATGSQFSKTKGASNVVGRANVALTGKNYYSLILGAANVVARAQIVVDFEVRKQIPYDEDAPDERTMLLPEQDRTMVVT